MNCAFPGCVNKIKAGTLCSSHYRQRAAGKVLQSLRLKHQHLSHAEQEQIRTFANLPILAGKAIGLYGGYPSVSIGRKNFRIHRLVMEAYLGRPLTHEETVHHGPLGKLNPSLQNLRLFISSSEHQKQQHGHGTGYCRNGHSLDSANVLTFGGVPRCRECNRIWHRNAYVKRKV